MSGEYIDEWWDCPWSATFWRKIQLFAPFALQKTKSIPFESHSNPFWGHLISIPLNSMWITKMTTNHSGLNSISFFFSESAKDFARMTWKLKEQHSQPPVLPESPWAEKIYHRRQVWPKKIGDFGDEFSSQLLWWIFILERHWLIEKWIQNILFGSERNPVNQLIWSHSLIVLRILRLYRFITHPAPAVSSSGQERPQKPVGDSPSASSTAFYHQDGADRRGLKLFQLLLSSQDVRCKHYITLHCLKAKK